MPRTSTPRASAEWRCPLQYSLLEWLVVNSFVDLDLPKMNKRAFFEKSLEGQSTSKYFSDSTQRAERPSERPSERPTERPSVLQESTLLGCAVAHHTKPRPRGFRPLAWSFLQEMTMAVFAWPRTILRAWTRSQALVSHSGKAKSRHRQFGNTCVRPPFHPLDPNIPPPRRKCAQPVSRDCFDRCLLLRSRRFMPAKVLFSRPYGTLGPCRSHCHASSCLFLTQPQAIQPGPGAA